MRAVAARVTGEGLRPVVDVGCGEGALRDALPAGWPWLGIDAVAWPEAQVLADAGALPVRDGAAGVVAALWVLYHLDPPAAAIAEGYRALLPGGLFVACTTARDDSPELLEHLPPQPPSSFDAEEAPDIVASVFGDVEVDRWDGRLVRLPDRQAVRDYLVGRAIGDELAADVAQRVAVPLELTKRGVLVWARRPIEPATKIARNRRSASRNRRGFDGGVA
ncbi:MAG: class I SAM-dependent methyltransferase [Acidimicrobiales bacterium]